MTITTGGPNEFRRWADNIRKSDLPKFAVDYHRAIHVELHSQLIQATPFGAPKTWQRPPPKGYVPGRARANWQASTTTPPTAERRGPNEANYDAGGALQEGQSVIATIQPYTRSYEVNNTPYIVALNDRPSPLYRGRGWSPQAPLQWIEKVMDRIVAKFG